MKRWMTILMVFFCLVSVAADPQVQLIAAYPNQLHLGWEAVPRADYYDVYLDGKPVKRVQQTSVVIGSNEDALESHRTYEVIVAARKTGNVELCASKAFYTTTGWEGRYRWLNKTSKDNKGKCRQLDFIVHFDEGMYSIQGIYDRPYVIFPLLPENRLGEDIPYEGIGEEQKAYRANAEVFNTTNFTPSTWSIQSAEFSIDRSWVEVQTKVGSLTFKTRSVYKFALSPKGEKELYFETKGEGVASWGIFKSPNAGENGVFKCTLVP